MTSSFLMVSASLLLEARRRAGLSQRELAVRAGVAQQEIARYERAKVTPSLERLRRLVAACGLELTVGIANADDSYDEHIRAALARAPARRLARAVTDAEPLRAARTRARHTTPSPAADALGAIRALAAFGVRYVLIGELAEVLHGSPLLPISATVTIVPRTGQRETLCGVIAVSCGRQIPQPNGSPVDMPARWTLDTFGVDLIADPSPPGTQGYGDLRRDARDLVLDEGLAVPVASLVDLVRIAAASPDRARVPALRRTLELSLRPGTRGADAA